MNTTAHRDRVMADQMAAHAQRLAANAPTWVVAVKGRSSVAHQTHPGETVAACGQTDVASIAPSWLASVEYAEGMARQSAYSPCARCAKAVAEAAVR